MEVTEVPSLIAAGKEMPGAVVSILANRTESWTLGSRGCSTIGEVLTVCVFRVLLSTNQRVLDVKLTDTCS